MTWKTVIGLETHVELSTVTKLFCGCSTAFGAPPNTQCCPVCAGLPGALPSLNRRAVEYAVRAALVLGCRVSTYSRFDRKHYVYPDLPKGYQITQFYHPAGWDGAVALPSGRTVRICEVHLEEDAGKLLHQPAERLTRVDYNRCGVPLLEIVTQPDFRSGEEAVAYLERLRDDLRYLGVSDCKIQEGSLRCDVNLSVRPVGSDALGTRTELKNLGSLRAVARAAEYESARQIALLESGGTVTRETRRWDEEKNVSLPMRHKEDARDYRYFPEPDLPPLVLSEAYIDTLRQSLPELRHQREERFRSQFALSVDDVRTLTAQKALADFFEAVVAQGAPPREAANWILGPVLRRLAAEGLEAEQLPLSPGTLSTLIALVTEGRLNRGTATAVLDVVFLKDADPAAYARENGLEQISDAAPVDRVVADVLAAHPGPAADYRNGTVKALGFLMGQVMRALGGKADPAVVRARLRAALSLGSDPYEIK